MHGMPHKCMNTKMRPFRVAWGRGRVGDNGNGIGVDSKYMRMR